MKKDLNVPIVLAKRLIDEVLGEGKSDTIVLTVIIGFKLIELRQKSLIIKKFLNSTFRDCRFEVWGKSRN